jgi:hypothetical protein
MHLLRLFKQLRRLAPLKVRAKRKPMLMRRLSFNCPIRILKRSLQGFEVATRVL